MESREVPVSRYRRWNELPELLAADAFARICTVAKVDVLVTDAGIAPADAAGLADAGVKVVTA
jgi:hypothetical protein